MRRLPSSAGSTRDALNGQASASGGLARRLRGVGHSIAPGLWSGGTETPMLLNAMGKDAVVRAAVEGGHPIGRLGSPFEISEAVAWLLSDAASFVTGAIFAIDGGYTCV